MLSVLKFRRTNGSRPPKSRADKVFDRSTGIFLGIVLLVVFIPLWYVLMISLTPLGYKDGPTLFLSPFNWSFEAYTQLLGESTFLQATLNSLFITLVGVSINMIMTVLTAYPLANKKLPGRRIIMSFLLFTYLFNAGLIPTYLLVNKLGLVNNYLAVILPGAISVYNLFIMKSFFQNLPESLDEAARIDGANDFQVLWRIIMPLSKPILLTIGMFYGVTHWNEFFLPLLYFNDKAMMPLPVILRDILSSAGMSEYVESNAVSAASQESLKMAAVVLTTLPMLIVYPWIQRYFTKGILLGGIKE
jgi:putative aldouronate transport system permease protein